jgi:GH25 family lysozyme M1 (1,4-beta-N-acetylmuramidase)
MPSPLLPPTVAGIDVSHYQGAIDWPMVRRAGIGFAIIKATEGEHDVDPMFVHNLVGAHGAGLIVGAYHFARPDLHSNPRGERENFLNTIAGYRTGGLGLICALDYETMPTRWSVGDHRSWVADWDGGLNALLYINRSFRDTAFSGWPVARHRRWYARPGAHPLDDVLWWQSGVRTVPGVDGPCDYNIFFGTMADLSPRKPRPPIPDPKPGGKVSIPAPMTVRQGDRGTAVHNLQALLAVRGYRLTADSKFGPHTADAVVSWQRRAHIGVDAVAGPDTWASVLGAP